jgi:uncharacterized protein YbjT (DUF2867 family)
MTTYNQQAKTLLIGANGQIGKKIATLMTQNRLPVKAMIRSEEQSAYFEQRHIETVIADLEADFEHAFKDCNQVIFSAGSGAQTGFDKTLLIDLWAAIKSIQYAEKYDYKRFVMISSRGAQNPDNGPERIKPYLVAKHAADNALRASNLNYTILQPGRLLDEQGTGLITTQRPQASEKQVISRDDVALAATFCLEQDATFKETFELFKGDTPILKALGRFC